MANDGSQALSMAKDARGVAQEALSGAQAAQREATSAQKQAELAYTRAEDAMDCLTSLVPRVNDLELTIKDLTQSLQAEIQKLAQATATIRAAVVEQGQATRDAVGKTTETVNAGFVETRRQAFEVRLLDIRSSLSGIEERLAASRAALESDIRSAEGRFEQQQTRFDQLLSQIIVSRDRDLERTGAHILEIGRELDGLAARLRADEPHALAIGQSVNQANKIERDQAVEAHSGRLQLGVDQFRQGGTSLIGALAPFAHHVPGMEPGSYALRVFVTGSSSEPESFAAVKAMGGKDAVSLEPAAGWNATTRILESWPGGLAGRAISEAEQQRLATHLAALEEKGLISAEALKLVTEHIERSGVAIVTPKAEG